VENSINHWLKMDHRCTYMNINKKFWSSSYFEKGPCDEISNKELKNWDLCSVPSKNYWADKILSSHTVILTEVWLCDLSSYTLSTPSVYGCKCTTLSWIHFQDQVGVFSPAAAYHVMLSDRVRHSRVNMFWYYHNTVELVLAVTSIKQQPVLSSQTKCSQMLNLYWYSPLLSSHLT